MKRRILAIVLLGILIAGGAFLLFRSPLIHQTKSTDFQDAPGENKIIFDELRKKNPDIYAWLEIHDTKISVPVCFRENDNAYYLEHNSSGQPDQGGAVFTEDYNTTDFTDPVTILYGHNGNMGGEFTSLQSGYTDPSFFQAHKRIKIYTPEKTLEYQVFAAVPYGNRHILYYYDFHNEKVFTRFFSDVFSISSLNAVTDATVAVTASDHVVILSTCLDGDDSQRFLVMAVLITETD